MSRKWNISITIYFLKGTRFLMKKQNIFDICWHIFVKNFGFFLKKAHFSSNKLPLRQMPTSSSYAWLEAWLERGWEWKPLQNLNSNRLCCCGCNARGQQLSRPDPWDVQSPLNMLNANSLLQQRAGTGAISDWSQREPWGLGFVQAESNAELPKQPALPGY